MPKCAEPIESQTHVAWRFNKYRQALHPEKPIIVTSFESPGGKGLHYQALHPGT